MLMKALGIDVYKCDNDSFESKIELDHIHDQGRGYVNGGVMLVLAEMSSGYCSTKLVNGGFAVGQTISGNHLNAKKCEGQLIAHGKLIRKGKTTHTWDIRIVDETDQLISVVIVTNRILMERKND